MSILSEFYGFCARCGSRLADGHLLPRKTIVITFIAQSLIVQLGNAKFFGGLSNVEVSKKYPSLVTPSGFAFAIWGLIYVWETIAVAHCYLTLRPSRSLEIAGIWFVMANIFQLLWALVFSRELLKVSSIFITAIAFCLCICLENLDNPHTIERYLIVLPISLHAGWVTAASLVNINLTFVQMNASSEIQLTVAFASVYLGLGAAFIFAAFRHNAIFALSLAWAFFAIYKELPASKALPQLDSTTRSAFRLTCICAAGLCLHLALTTIAFSFLQ
uniref:Uncharacterized protein n=1 Tax=Aureoumbra lagunensis TaxID=44058 RepID=A0A7S3NPM8_9STRA|mmetsp:Transcript_17868/g.26816  ORF Transcript_17868/g.26816 Transcript_17868/m.26816 type:complete len:274 (+) Transcript_17868:40-861(+)